MTEFKVYFAGGISQRDWRHEICAVLDNGPYCLNLHEQLPPEPSRIDLPTTSPHVLYSGPYFVSDCGHGEYHGDDSHGVGADAPTPVGNTRRADVIAASVSQIEDADAVFCVIDKFDAYGTIA